MKTIPVNHPFCDSIIVLDAAYHLPLERAMAAASILKAASPIFDYGLLPLSLDYENGFSLRGVNGSRLQINLWDIEDKAAAAIIRMERALEMLSANLLNSSARFPTDGHLLASPDAVWITNHTLVVLGVTDLIESKLDKRSYDGYVALKAIRLMSCEPSGHDMLEAGQPLEKLLPEAAALFARRAGGS